MACPKVVAASSRVRLMPALLAGYLLIAAGACGRTRMWAGSFFGRREYPQYSVADRVAVYGPRARARMLPHFIRAGVPYPPEKVTLVALKKEKRVELYASNFSSVPRLIVSYPILGASGVAGPKLREGDGQVPEGFYQIESLNPNSRFHLSLRLSYPNELDRQVALLEGRDRLGGDIMIHGSDISIGCLAMGDSVAEELFVLAADVGIERMQVIVSPSDLRKKLITPLEIRNQPPWVLDLYLSIKVALSALDRS